MDFNTFEEFTLESALSLLTQQKKELNIDILKGRLYYNMKL